jgi:hypothetical protein
MTDREALLLAFGALTARDLWRPGNTEQLRHIHYCRFCDFSSDWCAKHGHAKDCIYGRLQQHLSARGRNA